MTEHDQLERERQALQRDLDLAKTQADRNRLGQFATPSELAVEIVGFALSLLPEDSKIRFLEPGFGTGPFYSALLRLAPPTRIQTAAGYEIDAHYAGPAKRLWEPTDLRLLTTDFMKADPPTSETEKYNLAVCNPPYVRHHHLSAVQKRDMQAAVARSLNIQMNGLSGLYTYFMLLSQAWMSQEGVGAWLIPSEFMDVNYGRKVKDFLVDKVTLHRIHRFDPDDVQFWDALVSSAVVVFRNSPPSPRHEVEFTFGGSLEKPRTSGRIGLSDLRQVSKWTSLPQRLSRIASHHCDSSLADFFYIKRGLATGCNSFFVLTPEQVERFNLPRVFLQPILPSPRELESNEVPADGEGEPQIANPRYLLSCSLPESHVKAEYPTLWRCLERGIEEGLPERYLCRHRQPWYSQETRPPAPFLCTYMGRPTRRSRCPFRFILNYSNATAPNVYLMIYPKPILAGWLRESPERKRVVWEALSVITAEMLMEEGRTYGGGLHKLEPKELGNVDAQRLVDILPELQSQSKTIQPTLF
ncbi:MAG: Eco57I restriction-modification methylase domain-containing protein [Armatimonadetes bacterium]|nr:Eco57I restriction-modification methylase domain-containing protein [Armatimonadota bacterium]